MQLTLLKPLGCKISSCHATASPFHQPTALKMAFKPNMAKAIIKLKALECFMEMKRKILGKGENLETIFQQNNVYLNIYTFHF